MRQLSHIVPVKGVAFRPDGNWALSCGGRGVILWDIATGEELHRFDGGSDIYDVAFSPDGRRIVSGSNDRTVKVWDAATGDEVLTLRGHTGFIRVVGFSPDGHRIMSASEDGTVKVWDGTPLQTSQAGLPANTR